jgi:hypothetical protein
MVSEVPFPFRESLLVVEPVFPHARADSDMPPSRPPKCVEARPPWVQGNGLQANAMRPRVAAIPIDPNRSQVEHHEDITTLLT